ncbi:MAG: hypothetical protein GEV06_16730 [Luteitalea sp.]|nr:hypothetical protein [Luteitalea sp.]
MTTITIAINGAVRLRGEYDPATQAAQLAAELDHALPTLRQQGRVAIWAEAADGVAHLIHPYAS